MSVITTATTTAITIAQQLKAWSADCTAIDDSIGEEEAVELTEELGVNVAIAPIFGTDFWQIEWFEPKQQRFSCGIDTQSG